MLNLKIKVHLWVKAAFCVMLGYIAGYFLAKESFGKQLYTKFLFNQLSEEHIVVKAPDPIALAIRRKMKKYPGVFGYYLLNKSEKCLVTSKKAIVVNKNPIYLGVSKEVFQLFQIGDLKNYSFLWQKQNLAPCGDSGKLIISSKK